MEVLRCAFPPLGGWEDALWRPDALFARVPADVFDVKRLEEGPPLKGAELRWVPVF